MSVEECARLIIAGMNARRREVVMTAKGKLGRFAKLIAPGVVAWPDDMPEDERQKYLRRVPLARAGSPADVAKLVHFLVTDGSYITGQVIRLDGGRSIT